MGAVWCGVSETKQGEQGTHLGTVGANTMEPRWSEESFYAWEWSSAVSEHEWGGTHILEAALHGGVRAQAIERSVHIEQ